MKLSEQYARKINKNSLIEFEFYEKPATTEEEPTNSTWSVVKSLLPAWNSSDPISWAVYGTPLFLAGRYIGWPAYKNFFASGKPLSMRDWYRRFRNIKRLRKLGITPHESESMFRHFRNIIFQKDVHTLTDIINKVKTGKFTAGQGLSEAEKILPKMSESTKIDLLSKLKSHEPINITKPTAAKTANPYYTSTSTATMPKTKSTKITPEQLTGLSINQKAAYANNPNLTYAQLLKL